MATLYQQYNFNHLSGEAQTPSKVEFILSTNTLLWGLYVVVCTRSICNKISSFFHEFTPELRIIIWHNVKYHASSTKHINLNHIWSNSYNISCVQSLLLTFLATLFLCVSPNFQFLSSKNNNSRLILYYVQELVLFIYLPVVTCTIPTLPEQRYDISEWYVYWYILIHKYHDCYDWARLPLQGIQNNYFLLAT